MTRRQLLRALSPQELIEWKAYLRLERIAQEQAAAAARLGGRR